ncbi:MULTISPECIES: fimbrial biogenesis usher protein [unclassified Pseudomonas]|uniref:fimbrial biogenesis usher protein n=1 Tax=unclassified Pseudomonas TaxID=196821 RepID=UPI0015A38520|nr:MULTISPECIES: fimbrial biogenesis usher protein [unclassified Pseudomonas]NWC93109.1 fimbrial biogenesis usher protein [Pseudomonas sp. IPO3779]NWD19527.1 fimbrial biogenesis usher protein [Pseudomonas sp. IPO3778]
MKNGTRDSALQRLLLSPLALLLVGPVFSARADNYFNPRFLSDDPASVADLSGFEKGLEAPPGTYRVDIYMNDGYITTRDITFDKSANGQQLEPCLTRAQLSSFGVNTLAVPDIVAMKSTACVPFTRLITDASSRFDVGLQRLYLSVPQAFMGRQARGYIAPELWDDGITAGLLNYNYTGSEVRSQQGGVSNYSYLSLQSGLNLGAWRLRDTSTWSYSHGVGVTESQWQHTNTYLERGISSWHSRLTLGDGYTAGDIFDGINFRGVQIASDDNMLPDSQRGFAPVIRGIAQGTAKVSVKQNGYEIYQTTVPPGAFTINDIYAPGTNGDLQVTVVEANGSTQTYTVSYSSVPMLEREGQVKYSLTAGQYRSGNTQQDKPEFLQGTALWGLPHDWTVFGGTQVSNNYDALNIGVGKNLGDLGAISADLTQARATLSDDTQHQGQSLRFLYNKSVNQWGTNLQLLGYRYSTKNFYTLADTAWSRMSGFTVVNQDQSIQIAPQITDFYNLNYSKRGRFQATLTQQMGKTSTMYLTGSQQSYWGTGQSDEQLQLGYNSTIGDISWGMNYSLTKSAWADNKDQQLAFNISIPFSHWMRSDSYSSFKRTNASFNTSSDLKGRDASTAGLYGTLLDDNNLSYSVQTGYANGSNEDVSKTGNTALNYRGPYGNTNIGYSTSEDYSQVYYGLSGGVLAHADGVTFGQPLNDTVVLIKVPGADHVAVENQTGIRTDWRGYAVLPYAVDYRENRIALNTNSLANNIELEDPILSVVPTRGAVVRADFKARVGMKVLMTLNHNDKPVPFGSIASYGEGLAGSIVADDGQVYLTGLSPTGQINVRWGDASNERCTATYSLPAESQALALSYASAECR